MYFRTIKLLWHSGYWDGATNGMCEIEGKKYWFDMAGSGKDEVLSEMYFELFNKNFNEENFDRVRFYYVYKLSEEIIDSLVQQHELFKQYVGYHTDYDQNNIRSIENGMKTEEERSKFYDNKESIDINLYLIRENRIGWFDSNSIYYYGKDNK